MFESLHGFEMDGDDEEDQRIVGGAVMRGDDHEAAVYSAIRMATEGIALLDNEGSMNPVERSHISRVDRIRRRRGAFRWLPVLCSNDTEHGSWWFVYGSLLGSLVALVPLLKDVISELEPSDDTLPALSFYGTWTMLVVSGVFYTVGSYAFARAFEEPPNKPIFSCRHFATDELVGAWFFLLGTIPCVPFSLMYWATDPKNLIYCSMCIASVVFVICSILFVIGCYPTSRERRDYVRPLVRNCCGASHWSVKHLQNDWLATTWFSFWTTFFCLIGTIGFFWSSVKAGNVLEQIVYGGGVIGTFFFLIGSMYFVAGSYPVDIMRCYQPKFKKSDVDGASIIIQFGSFER